jgi:hypothetical protein
MFFLYSFTHVLEFVIEDTKQKKTKKNKWLPISIRFVPTVEETQAWIALVLPRMIIGSFCVIFVSGLWQMLIVFISHRNGCTVKQILYLIWTLCISVHVFVASTMTFSTLDHSFQEKLLFSSNIFKNAYVLTEKFHVVHPYGLFRRMTGIGKLKNEGEMILARPEIILEKTFDQGQTWKEFSFHYKPGDLFTSPRRAMPFQPRLDWQMWFAALEEDYQKAPWLVHLIDKLLENTKEVKALLDLSKQQQQQEEEESSPQAIRAVLYYYDYTRWNTSWSFQIPNAFFLNETNSKQWWHRFHPKEYLPPLEKNNPSVKAFLKQFGWTTRTSKTTKTLTCWQEWWCFLIEKLIQWKEIGAISMALSIWMLEDCYWRVVVVVKKKKLKKF